MTTIEMGNASYYIPYFLSLAKQLQRQPLSTWLVPAVVAFLLPLTNQAQKEIEGLPEFLPAHQQAFSSNTGLSRICVSDAFIDAKGRLWLNTCNVEKAMYMLPLVQFDGYQFVPANTESLKLSSYNSVKFAGLAEDGLLYGYNNRDSTINTFFSFDPNSQESSLLNINDLIPFGAILRGIFRTKAGQWMFFFRRHDRYEIYVKEGDSLSLQLDIPYAFYPKQIIDIYQRSAVQIGEEIWFMDFLLPLVRWNPATGKWKKYDASDIPLELQLRGQYVEKYWYIPPSRMAVHNGQLIICLPAYQQNHFFRFLEAEDRFVPIAGFPDTWHAENLFPDRSGNLVYLFTDGEGRYQAVLEDKDGRQFNYSALLVNAIEINKLLAEDFKKELFVCTTDGIFTKTVRQANPITTYLEGVSMRAITALPDGKFLASTSGSGWHLIDDKLDKTALFTAPSCDNDPFHHQMRRTVVTRKDGSIWTYKEKNIFRYDPKTQACQAFPTAGFVHIFTFLSQDSVAYWDETQDSLYIQDLRTGKSAAYTEEGQGFRIESFIQELQPSRDGQLWITTNSGLLKVDYKNRKSKLTGLGEGFRDYRFITVREDEKGRLWMGTYLGGLHIYDPGTGDLKILDKAHGLANNTVVSILPDDEGIYWIGTYNGISLVSPEGKVITNIGEAEGLAHREFNRYSYYKAPDGRLLMGTVAGLNIIDPSALKEQLSLGNYPKIYLTEIQYYNKKKEANITLARQAEFGRRIELAADNRNLKLQFALSSYFLPEKNQYAYKLEGINEDWHYIGTQRELSLSNLPAGQYKLLIKGSDYRGIWSEQMVAANIHARDFFYRQYWFYLLCFAVVGAVVFIWISYLRGEKKRLEQEVKKRTRQIRRDKDLIEQQAQELKQVDELKSRFFTNISHELRTPATLIATPIEQILRKYAPKLESELKHSLNIVLNNSRKLLSLIEELLELSHIDAGKSKPDTTPVVLLSFCRQLFSAYESAAQLKNIEYQLHFNADENLRVLIDKKRLEKIINNLLSNALKFTSRGGSVQLTVSREQRAEKREWQAMPENPDTLLSDTLLSDTPFSTHCLLLTVSDTGRGIPPEDLPYIFDRYFQTRRQDIPKEGGTGIGMALARELAELMGGNLTVKSEWRKGSTFTLKLPAQEVQFEMEAAEALSTSSGQTMSNALATEEAITQLATNSDEQATALKQGKILIVEDNPDMQYLLQDLLCDTYNCLIANNGAEAWELLHNEDLSVQDVSLILSDIMMPEMDGYALLEHLKADDKCRQLPVIMLTARAAESDKLQALRLGVDDYLTKPFSPEELLVRAANLIRNHRERQAFKAAHPQPVEIGFEAGASADQEWLKELEAASLNAIEKKIELSRSYLADAMALSERQLLRRLKALTGLSVKHYVQEVKLQKARLLLKNKTYLTVAEVAYASGFNAAGYFAKVYKKHFGKNPSEYFSEVS